ELLEGAQQLRVDLVEALRAVGLLLRRRVVDDVLEIDRRIVDLRPLRLGHRDPAAVGTQPPLEHELGLALAFGDQADRVLRQALGYLVGLDLRDEAGRVLAIEEGVELGGGGTHAMDSSQGCATRARTARRAGRAGGSSSGTTRIMS